MEYKYIGTITGTRGYSGEMRVSDLQFSMIEIKENSKIRIGYSLNFSKEVNLKKWRQTRKSAKIEIKGINDNKQAADLIESGVFIKDDDIKIKTLIGNDVHYLMGYTAIDNISKEKIGEIVDILELPANDVIVIDIGTKNIPVPYVEEFIKSTDEVNKIIFVELVDGLSNLSM